MGDHVRALMTYAAGLAQDAANEQLLGALVECANMSMLKDSFNAVYEELVSLRLENSAFVVVSVVGQELLSAGLTQEAVQVLESAVRIDTTSLKLKQSVLSSLSSAYWRLNDRKRAAEFMLQDLAVAASLGDSAGESRAHANLGMLRLAEDDVVAALDHYRQQLLLELKVGNHKAAATVLSIVGQLYFRVGDFDNALDSYQQCLEMMPGLPIEERADPMEMAAQVEGMGDVYFAKNDYEAALDCYRRCFELARANKRPSDQAKATCAIGRTLIKEGRTEEGMLQLKDALALAKDAKDKAMEATVCGQMSAACQLREMWAQAKRWAEKELQIGLRLKDAALEGEACGHLGVFYQQAGDLHSALRLHEKHLELAQSIADNGSVMLAYRNLGLCCLASGNVDGALHYHKGELELARRSGDRCAESGAHGNLARVYGRLNNSVQQFTHLQCQWQLVKNTNNLKAQAKALTALGEFHADSADHGQAVLYLEKSLMLAQEQADIDTERNNCALLGRAHLALSQAREATRYFEQELAISKDQRNHAAMALAYKHLGDAQFKLGRYDEALDCQKYFLALAHISSDVTAKLDAMQKIGGILLQRRDVNAAVKVFSKGLKLAVACKNAKAEAQLYGQLGHCHVALRQPEKTMAFYSEELAKYNAINDARGKFDAFGHIADHYSRERRSDLALRMCANRIEVGRCAGDTALEAEGYAETGNICKLFSLFDDALKSYEEALRLLGENSTTNTLSLRLSLLVNVAECSEKLGRIADAVGACQKYLQLNAKPAEMREQVHRKLGSLFLLIGRFGDSANHFDASIELITSASFPCAPEAVVESYRGLAAARVGDGDLEEAAEALDERLRFVRQLALSREEGLALSDVGLVYRLQGHDQLAMEMIEKDVELCEQAGDTIGVVRALHTLCHLLECRMDSTRLSTVVVRLGQIADASTGTISVDSNNICNQHERSLSVALRALILTPDECREALRVILHLVEKSLQRIHCGQESVMYTSENSVRSKVGPEAAGWRETLEALGFTRSIDNGDANIHFPRSEHTAALSLGSSVFQALLGLPQTTLVALSQLAGDLSVERIVDLVRILEELATQLTTRLPHYEATLSASLYNHPGISRLFASLGFDKLLENTSQVFVKTIRVELTNKKCQLAVTAIKAMFSDLLIGYHVTDTSDSRSSPIESLTRRLGQVDVADSPMDRLGRENGLPSSALSCGKRRRGRKGAHISGYSSEGELKATKGKRGGGGGGGYFSDDDRKRGLRNEDDDEGMMSGGELLETTARVLSIDERASPISDDDIQSPFAHQRSSVLYPHCVTVTPSNFSAQYDVPSLVVSYEPNRTPLMRPPPPSYESVRRRQEELNSSALETGDESDAELLRCVASKYVRYSPAKHGAVQQQRSLQTDLFNSNQINAHTAPFINPSMI
uniref:Uncharacterized protein n=1 Tax=Plectus sambesii TaxID=2011161 RepID=A0A914WWE4_9BILA